MVIDVYSYPEIGIVSNHKLQADEYLFTRESRLAYKESMRNNQPKYRMVTIQPVGNYCEGNCAYCFEHMPSYISNKHIKTLSPEKLDLFLTELQDRNLVDSSPVFNFTGGDPFLCPDINEYIDVCKKHTSDFKMMAFVNLMWSHDKYIKITENIYKCSQQEDTSSLCLHLSVDYGAPSLIRQCPINNLKLSDIQHRAIDWKNLFQNNSKVLLVLKSHISKQTDVSALVNRIAPMYNTNCLFSFLPIDHLSLTPTEEQVDELFVSLKTHFGIAPQFRESILNIRNDYLESNMKHLCQTYWKEISEGVFQFCPEWNDCSAYTESIGLTEEGIISCSFATELFPSIDAYRNNAKNTRLLAYPDECNSCPYLISCMRCANRRYEVPCSSSPALLRWQKNIWDTLCAQQEYWVLDTQNPRGSYTFR